MALRNIFKQGDEILTKKCREVTEFDQKLHLLLDDMAETLDHANGAGLAAPQVGVLKRVAIVLSDDGIIELVNPIIVYKSGKQVSPEGCLSIPGVTGDVERPKKVIVRAKDRYGKEFEVTGEDFLAKAFCHEIDHLDGILFITKAFNIERD